MNLTTDFFTENFNLSAISLNSGQNGPNPALVHFCLGKTLFYLDYREKRETCARDPIHNLNTSSFFSSQISTSVYRKFVTTTAKCTSTEAYRTSRQWHPTLYVTMTANQMKNVWTYWGSTTASASRGSLNCLTELAKVPMNTTSY